MRTVRIRTDKKATTGKKFVMEIDGYDDIVRYEGQDTADDCTLYGYNVYLQKTIGEAGGKGRDYNLIIEHLDAKGVPYTVEDYTVGEKIVDPKLALVAGLSYAQLAELVEQAKGRAEK